MSQKKVHIRCVFIENQNIYTTETYTFYLRHFCRDLKTTSKNTTSFREHLSRTHWYKPQWRAPISQNCRRACGIEPHGGRGETWTLPTRTDEMKQRHRRDEDISQCLLFLDFLWERCGERERERDFLEDFFGVRDLDLRERLGVAEGEGDLHNKERRERWTHSKHKTARITNTWIKLMDCTIPP